MSRIIIAVILLLFSISIHAKSLKPWDEYLEALHSMEEFESVDWEQYAEMLTELSENPMNINTATREDLERFPFLNAQQIEDILAYIYQYGQMRSLGELAMIESLGWYQHKLLEYFVYAGNIDQNHFPNIKNIAKYGKHELVGLVSVPFYERRGDQYGYLGYPYRHWIKYQFHYSDFVKFGLTGSQDAGEPFLANKNNTGYDFYSFYFQIKKLGRIKNLTLGRYRLRFGMGLILNNDFGFGKVAALSSLGRNGNNIRVHSSRSSGNYLQGVASTISLSKNFDLTAFLSYRNIDATLAKDGNIQTILKTGYHRTILELSKKDNSSQFLAGGNINYFSKGFHAGVTSFYTSLDKRLEPRKTQIYKWFAPEGKYFWNASIDYGYVSRKLNVSGETATGDCGAIATINSASYLLTDELSIMALQRFYSYKYYSLFSSSFSEGSGVQDENGCYLGLDWSPLRNLSFKGYTDFAYFIWPKYGTQNTSQSWDNYLSASYHTSRWQFLLSGRYKFRNKDVNQKLYVTTTRGKMSVGYTSGIFSEKTQIDVSDYLYDKNSFGYLLSENIRLQKAWLKLDACFGYFHTQDYQSRVFAYEAGTLYNISFPMFYGEGIHYAFIARTDIGKHLMLIAKIATTDYFDRNHISTSYQQINQSSKTDLEIQVKLKM